MKVELAGQAFEDLAWWVKHDRKKALRLIRLIREAARNPSAGTGKPEPLRGSLSGYWSRRIDSEHRLVYRVDGETLKVVSCRYHYR